MPCEYYSQNFVNDNVLVESKLLNGWFRVQTLVLQVGRVEEMKDKLNYP